jgi:hypothetical protein
MNPTRGLAASLAPDVVGYSRLMGVDAVGDAKSIKGGARWLIRRLLRTRARTAGTNSSARPLASYFDLVELSGRKDHAKTRGWLLLR